jgi:hypothetical protein
MTAESHLLVFKSFLQRSLSYVSTIRLTWGNGSIKADRVRCFLGCKRRVCPQLIVQCLVLRLDGKRVFVAQSSESLRELKKQNFSGYSRAHSAAFKSWLKPRPTNSLALPHRLFSLCGFLVVRKSRPHMLKNLCVKLTTILGRSRSRQWNVSRLRRWVAYHKSIATKPQCRSSNDEARAPEARHNVAQPGRVGIGANPISEHRRCDTLGPRSMVLTHPLEPLLLGPQDVYPERANGRRRFRVGNAD